MVIQIAAEENCLQLMNGKALEALRDFCAATQVLTGTQLDANLTQVMASRLLQIPALYHVIQHELKTEGVQLDTIGVCHWLYIRGATVLKLLRQYPAPSSIEISIDDADPEGRWQDVY